MIEPGTFSDYNRTSYQITINKCEYTDLSTVGKEKLATVNDLVQQKAFKKIFTTEQQPRLCYAPSGSWISNKESKWFNPEDNTYANGEQPYLIFPLKTGITPDELKEKVFEKYVQTMMEKDNGHLNTGMIGTQITFDYLLENNHNDLIDIMVKQKTYPGWGYMVEKGATTCWEQWNGFY